MLERQTTEQSQGSCRVPHAHFPPSCAWGSPCANIFYLFSKTSILNSLILEATAVVHRFPVRAFRTPSTTGSLHHHPSPHYGVYPQSRSRNKFAHRRRSLDVNHSLYFFVARARIKTSCIRMTTEYVTVRPSPEVLLIVLPCLPHTTIHHMIAASNYGTCLFGSVCSSLRTKICSAPPQLTHRYPFNR